MAKKNRSKGIDEVKELGKTGTSGFKMPSASSSDSKERWIARWAAEQSRKVEKGELSADMVRKIGFFAIPNSPRVEPEIISAKQVDRLQMSIAHDEAHMGMGSEDDVQKCIEALGLLVFEWDWLMYSVRPHLTLGEAVTICRAMWNSDMFGYYRCRHPASELACNVVDLYPSEVEKGVDQYALAEKLIVLQWASSLSVQYSVWLVKHGKRIEESFSLANATLPRIDPIQEEPDSEHQVG